MTENTIIVAPEDWHSREEADRALIRSVRIASTPSTLPLAVPLEFSEESVELPAVDRFVAATRFTPDNRIGWLSDDFQRVMLPLVEESVAPTTLTFHTMRTLDNPKPTIVEVAAALGVDETGTVSLAHFFDLMMPFRRGEPLPLRTNGLQSVAFVRGADGGICAVSAYMGDRKWHLCAVPLRDSTFRLDVDARYLARIPKVEARTEKRTFPVFKTIRLGTRRSIHKLREALVLAKVPIDRHLSAVLDKVSVAKPKQNIELDLVAADLRRDLGFTRIAGSREAIYARGLELGLQLCPAEVAPQLLLQGWERRRTLDLLVAMRPLIGLNDEPVVFEMTLVQGKHGMRVFRCKDWTVSGSPPLPAGSRGGPRGQAEVGQLGCEVDPPVDEISHASVVV